MPPYAILGNESVRQPHIYVCVARIDSGARIPVTHFTASINPDSSENSEVD